MGKVTEELISLIKKQIQDYGIVVWYDPEKDYNEVFDNLDIPDVSQLRHEGAHLDLRYRLETFLEYINENGQFTDNLDTLPRVLIYAPMNRIENQRALIEAESAGVVMEPGASPWQRNTRLKVLAERVFKNIAPDRASAIAAEVEAGHRTLAELDWLADQTGELGSIKLIFGTTNVAEVVLEFLNSEEHDQVIINKQALSELTGLCGTELGINLDPEQPVEQLRGQLGQALLLSELALRINSAGGEISKFAGLNLPEADRQREQLLSLCQQWRNRLDMRESYAMCASRVQTGAQVISLGLQPENLAEIETFSCIESMLLDSVEVQILAGQSTEVFELTGKRKASFWSLYEGEFQLRWTLLEIACQLLLTADRIQAEIKISGKDVQSIVQAYTSGVGNEPWCFLDRHQRYLEYRYAMLDFRTDGEHEQLEQVIRHVRTRYNDVVGLCAESLAKAISKSGYEVEGFLSQDQVFSNYVHPVITEGKTAYFLVDALRYEMGQELIGGLGEDFEVTLIPTIAQLPTITEIGMAALMPGADKGMDLVDVGARRVGLEINGTILKDRASRIKYFKSQTEGQPLILKLNQLMKPTKKRQQEITDANILIVTSQEIDRHGEETDDEEEARRFMDEVLEKLRRGIRRLASLGVRNIIVTADHGHLFVDDQNEAMRIDAPGGHTADMHPRVWIGRGGTASDSYIRVKASDLGLGGDLELVFPSGLATFKTKGANRGYFHGGISLQEMIIPLAAITIKEVIAPDISTSTVSLTLAKPKVTTRFFSIEARYEVGGLFGDNTKRIKVSVRSKRTEAGIAAMAAYGFEEGTQEILLEKEKPNSITIMLTVEVETPTISVHVLDVETQVELASLKGIPVEITI